MCSERQNMGRLCISRVYEVAETHRSNGETPGPSFRTTVTPRLIADPSLPRDGSVAQAEQPISPPGYALHSNKQFHKKTPYTKLMFKPKTVLSLQFQRWCPMTFVRPSAPRIRRDFLSIFFLLCELTAGTEILNFPDIIPPSESTSNDGVDQRY